MEPLTFDSMFGITDTEITKLVSITDYSEPLTITSTRDHVLTAAEDAKRYGFRAVVAFPQHLGLLVESLKGSSVLAQIPVGFPCGGQTTHVKCTEAEEGLKRGATDLDMVMNIAAFQEGNYKLVSEDIMAIMKVAEPYGVPFKVIIEVGVMSDAQIVKASNLVTDCGADFIKTCTGFGPGRATMHNISLIVETVGDKIGIKASGGVASLEDGVALMRAGATVVALRHMLVEALEQRNWPAKGEAATLTSDN